MEVGAGSRAGGPARRLKVILALVVALLVPTSIMTPAGAVASAFDYTKVRNLSQPVYGADQIVRETVLLPMADGVGVHVEVTRPKGEGPFPTILEASPYHGTLADREGTRIL